AMNAPATSLGDGARWRRWRCFGRRCRRRARCGVQRRQRVASDAAKSFLLLPPHQHAQPAFLLLQQSFIGFAELFGLDGVRDQARAIAFGITSGMPVASATISAPRRPVMAESCFSRSPAFGSRAKSAPPVNAACRRMAMASMPMTG